VQRAIELRVKLADYYAAFPIPEHVSNGDDDRYATENYFASYTKGLPHSGVRGAKVWVAAHFPACLA
jgi:hypothetical protein